VSCGVRVCFLQLVSTVGAAIFALVSLCSISYPVSSLLSLAALQLIQLQ